MSFNYGDWVRFKLDESIIGIVVGYDAHGINIDVQLEGCGCIETFFSCTLEVIDEATGEPDLPEEAPQAEVINFTEAKALRAGTKTRGVA